MCPREAVLCLIVCVCGCWHWCCCHVSSMWSSFQTRASSVQGAMSFPHMLSCTNDGRCPADIKLSFADPSAAQLTAAEVLAAHSPRHPAAPGCTAFLSHHPPFSYSIFTLVSLGLSCSLICCSSFLFLPSRSNLPPPTISYPSSYLSSQTEFQGTPI